MTILKPLNHLVYFIKKLKGSNSFCNSQAQCEFDLAVSFTLFINQVDLFIAEQLCRPSGFIYRGTALPADSSSVVWSEQFLSRFIRNSFLKLIYLHSFSKRKNNL